jgi:hypothetical protein
MGAVKKTDVFYSERITDGRFVTSAVKELMRELEGKQVEVCIRPRRNYTSNPQRRYYRGVCIRLLAMTMRENGINGPHGGPITDEQVHEMCAQRWLRRTVVISTDTGECMDIVMSTSNLTTGEMTEYIEQIRQWASETLALDIPDPNQAGDVRLA